jgi:Rod binding domain-containing protein
MEIRPIDNSVLPAQNKQGVASHGGEHEEQKLKKAAQSFESFFVAMLFEKMQKTAGGKGLFGKGTSGDVYGHLFNQAIGDAMAAQDSFGLSKMMMEHLHKKEMQSTPKLLDATDR